MTSCTRATSRSAQSTTRACTTLTARDLLRSLLSTDLSKRLGNLHRGSRDIFSHLWFAEINWSSLYRKEIPAPYIPNISLDGNASQCVAVVRVR